MSARFLFPAALACALAASAAAQTRTGVVVEPGVPGTNVGVGNSGLAPGGAVPSISLSVPALTGPLSAPSAPAPVVAPVLVRTAKPAASIAAVPVVAAVPGEALPLLPGEAGAFFNPVPEKEPETPRARKAVATIRDTSRHWTGEPVDKNDDPTVGEFWAGMERRRAGALEKAGTQAKLGAVEGAVARAFWRLESSRLRARAERTEQGASVPELLARRGTPVAGYRAALLNELTAYVPSLQPALVRQGEALSNLGDAGVPSGGYAVIPLRERPESRERGGYVWLNELTDLGFIEVAAHEGVHQGDLGYTAGYRALKSLYGEKAGEALGTALLEGFTELRAREAMDALGRDAAAGRKGLPEAYGSALRGRFGGKTLEEALKRRDEDRKEHGYDPYVSMVSAIVAKPGGREAVEAYVARGETAGLEALVGRAVLGRAAQVAAAAVLPDSATPLEHRLADSLGASGYVRRELWAAVSGFPTRDPRRLRAALDAVVSAGVETIGTGSRPEDLWRRKAVLGLRIAPESYERLSPAALGEAVRAQGVLPEWKRWIPPASPAFNAVVYGGWWSLSLATYPAVGVLWLINLLLGGGGAAQVLGGLAALAALWLSAQVVSGVALGRRPSRWLPSRWSN